MAQAPPPRRWEALLRRAIDLARPHHPHPNPRVGAVVVSPEGAVVGEGAHTGPGEEHAEAAALRIAGAAARGGTLLVTLEPCDHHGRTPPCTEAILAARVATVVYGASDPDARVAGRGHRRLKASGVEVVEGVLAGEVEEMDPAYFHHRRTGLPLVTLKSALTLDGQTATVGGESRWVTSEEAREDAHRLRWGADAVVVGAGTLLADDPLLTVRVPVPTTRQPRPVVVAGRRPLPSSARLWERSPVVVAPAPLAVPAGEVVEAPGEGGRVDLPRALRSLADAGMLSLLVEGGPTLAASLLRADLVRRGVFYLAARLAGGVGRPVFSAPFAELGATRRIEVVEVGRVGPDLRVEWRT